LTALSSRAVCSPIIRSLGGRAPKSSRTRSLVVERWLALYVTDDAQIVRIIDAARDLSAIE
jgi:hypothetical protein